MRPEGEERGPRNGGGVAVAYIDAVSGCSDDASRDAGETGVERFFPTGSQVGSILPSRRKAFAERRARFESALEVAGHENPVFPNCCPCCGYPTLLMRGYYEVCSLCCWEDESQDDPNADVVEGGPNGDYSLTEARTRFDEAGGRFGMYRPDDATRYVMDDWPLREALMDALDTWLDAGGPTRPLALVEQVARATLDLARHGSDGDLPPLPERPGESPDFVGLAELPDPMAWIRDARSVLCGAWNLVKSIAEGGPYLSPSSDIAIASRVQLLADRVNRLDPALFRMMPALRSLGIAPPVPRWIVLYALIVIPVLFQRAEAEYADARARVEAEELTRSHHGNA